MHSIIFNLKVNYKFNSTGSDPTFEVSLYRKSEPNRVNPIENESNVSFV